MRNRELFIILLASSLLAAQPLAAATIHVPADQPTIQAGIDAAVAGDTVLVDCGIYYEHDILMKSGVVLRSETGDANCVTIDAQQQGRVLLCEDTDDATRIEGFTITGGYLTQEDQLRGGGIACISAATRISHCRFEQNEAFWGGGGVYVAVSSAWIEDCEFLGNEGIDGGAIFCSGYSVLTLGSCLFTANDAMFWGGAIYLWHTEADISHCTLAGNSAGWGAGVYFGDSTLDLSNSIVALSSEGHGIYLVNREPSSEYTVVCCDVYGNVEGNYGGEMDDQTGIDGNISVHPFFCDYEAGDYTLAAGSPCLPENNDCGVLMGAYGQGCDHPTAATESAPDALRLAQNTPNPFNPRTEIRFALPEAGRVDLAVFDLAGRRVRRLIEGQRLEQGEHSAIWQGRDDAGRALASGVYLYRLEAGPLSATKKMTLLQ